MKHSRVVVSLGGLVLATGMTAVPAAASSSVLYVSAAASIGGDGSRDAPYNSLAAVESASGPGDTIVVLPAPRSTAPLDGGIALKSGQTLEGAGRPVTDAGSSGMAARITNTSAARNAGDAVRLATGNTVRNLEITGSFRGGIYGQGVGSARIEGNDVSGANTSCTKGFFIYFPSDALSHVNGWGAIMIDADHGASSLVVQNNRLHDAACSDGIDVRASGTARVTARVDRNEVTRLQQGAAFDSLLAIGMQTRDRANLTVTSSRNTQTYNGSPGANCEGVFANQTGGELTWHIDHNTYAHGIGGTSCNGGEFFVGGGPAVMNVDVAHSTFEDNPGDMIEENNLGAGSTLRLTLRDVTARHTTRTPALPPEPTIPPPAFSSFTSHGFCMSQFSTGPRASTQLHMVDSHFSDCATDGIFAFYANLPDLGFGSGPGKLSSVDIENSTIRDVGQYALHWVNYADLDALKIKARRSAFTGARGNAVVAFDQAEGATTATAAIDLGGGALRSEGRNCVFGGSPVYAEATRYNVSMRNDWWGTASGPAPQTLSTTSGDLATQPVLTRAPARCASR
ncbi:right-handed parallel beta-helix repeat-containing protein [Actinomadura nitritigenes]|uniref:right-handed parallel beta-helix repeat-containing protein n=1 Tax=Actinomadura nitritigenes TaxID=134602 RepID=UPI003D8E3DFE